MSVRFPNEAAQVVHVENYPQRPRVAFERMTSREERAEGFQHLKVFKKYDTDHDGYLSICELKKLITRNPAQCKDIPKGVSDYLFKFHDEDGDGKLSFTEFYELARKNHWVVRDWCVKYCEYIIPPRKCTMESKIAAMPMAASAVNYDTVDFARTYTIEDDYGTFDGDYYEDQMKFWPPKLTMVIFSLIEVIFFVIDVVHLQEYDGTNIGEVGRTVKGPMATLFIYNPYRRYEAWRFLTYMFVHIGVMHLMMNLLIQIFLGIFLEVVHCWWRVALIYLAGVLAGSMGTSIYSPKIFLAGASGGVYALITAHVASIIMNWKEMRSGMVQLFFFLIYIITDIAMSYHRHATDPRDNVGYMAHLCGGIAGLLVGIGVLRNLEKKPHEKYVWWIAVTIYSGLMIAGICFHIFYPDHFLTPRTNL